MPLVCATQDVDPRRVMYGNQGRRYEPATKLPNPGTV